MAIYDGLLEANEIFPIRTEADRTERLRLQRAALTECKKLLHMIELSKKRSYIDKPPKRSPRRTLYRKACNDI